MISLSAAILGYIGWKNSAEVKVIVDWSTASELNTAGFYIYRGETQDGPFEKISRELIPSSTDPLTGGDYSYVDNDVTAGKEYYYLLEEVEMDGNTNRHGPIVVAARRGGVIELGLAAFIGLIGLIGLIRGVLFSRKTTSPTSVG